MNGSLPAWTLIINVYAYLKWLLAVCYSYGRYVMMHACTGFGWVMTCNFCNIHTPTHDWMDNLSRPVNISNCPVIALGDSVNKGQVGDADVKWLEVIYRLHSVLKWHFDGTQPCHGPRMGSIWRHTHAHTYPDIPNHTYAHTDFWTLFVAVKLLVWQSQKSDVGSLLKGGDQPCGH